MFVRSKFIITLSV